MASKKGKAKEEETPTPADDVAKDSVFTKTVTVPANVDPKSDSYDHDSAETAVKVAAQQAGFTPTGKVEVASVEEQTANGTRIGWVITYTVPVS